MPLQATSGAASYDAFGGGGAAVEPNYIESVFSTYLYKGNGGAQTITNNIDLSTKGGLVWIKNRGSAVDNALVDTARGAGQYLISNSTAANTSTAGEFTGFTTSGFGLDSLVSSVFNGNNQNYASWTFRKAPKFFDVVTYTGNTSGGSSQTIAHNLGSIPGCIIVKATSIAGENWAVWHRSFTTNQVIYLDLTNAVATTGAGNSFPTLPTDTNFTVGFNGSQNGNGTQYVAYLFAHNAGGFGLTGTDNVISCGSYTGNVTVGNAVTLGYEPQWVLVKRATGGTGSWYLYDTMRGMTANAGGNTNPLNPNLSDAEGVNNDGIAPSATGFTLTSTSDVLNGSGFTYIYIAIRRGPMKVPTTGTSVFSPVTYTGNGTTQTITSGNAPLDLVWIKGRSPDPENPRIYDRLRGATQSIDSTSTAAETTRSGGLTAFTQTGFTVGSFGNENGSGSSIVSWNFKRAPSFFDEVCYTGTDTGTRILDHNLAVFPELVIVKKRSAALGWAVQASTFTDENILFLNTTAALTSTASYLSYPEQNTSTTFKVRYNLNVLSATYVAYLFATCAGVSKVGSYTGNGTTQTINCGFGAGGARFVLIKRTDSTGDWYVYDTARGMTVLTDPYLLLNSTAAETATLGSVTTVSTGFAVNASILAAINTNAASYIFLAIA